MTQEALKAAIKAMRNSNSISYEMMHAIADCKEALAQPPLPVQPERPWVGLTGLEQKAIMAMNSRNAVFETEAKLKEKNHG